MPRDIGVVIVAAGQGSRMGGGTPKQYRDLAGIPMLLRSLRPFTAHPDVEHVVVVLPPGDVAAPPPWLAGLIGGSLSLVAGGAERSDSVSHGLSALPGHCAIVLVHDAARPLVDRPTIDRVVAVARSGAGAVPAIPLGDTLKEAAPDDPALRIRGTVPRERLWRAQTPQGFSRPLLEEAYARARGEGVRGTDDAMLLERLGATVRLVPGSSLNFKVTTDEDFRLAELVVRSRSEE
ncbi:MAG TPA: 2-C-methyl-D-erythritol 4-phosphate cytidylyltransferase [Gemmatimonadales bacterium]|nr:2-C-methyl-D-erythritol 4-phosphate cytidylyltransferase [Gemmatimonadales bacterium]